MIQIQKSTAPGDRDSEEPDKISHLLPFSIGCALYFVWGVITVMNDVLAPYLKSLLNLNYKEASMVQFVSFTAYFVISLPVKRIVDRFRYKKAMALGLLCMSIGAFLFYPAAEFKFYALFLAALFVLFSGITLLQVAVNPYVALLGNPKHAASRLSLATGFNSVGTTITPILASYLIYTVFKNAPDASAIRVMYVMMGIALLLFAALLFNLNIPENLAIKTDTAEVKEHNGKDSPWQFPHFRMGVLAIFLYVGTEVTIGTYLVNYLQSVAGYHESEAMVLISYYWGSTMVGRFIGTSLLKKFPARVVITFFAVVAMLLVLSSVLTTGHIAVVAILSVGFFNSVMWATLFSMSIQGLGKFTNQGSSFLVMAIVGGAIVPFLQGALADVVGIRLSYLLPVVGYCYIAWFGYRSIKMNTSLTSS